MTKSTLSPLSAQAAQADHHETPSAYRDLALKSRREIHSLKRLVSRFIATCTGKNTLVDQKLTEFRDVLYSAQDVSALLPRLAVIERMVGHQDMTQKKALSHLDEQFHTSGETLQRVTGLPAQLKRDLRDLLAQPMSSDTERTQHLIKLLQLYERAVTLQVARPRAQHAQVELDKDQIRRVADELQNLITELDIDGQAGDKLLEIRRQLLTDVSPTSVVSLTLTSLRLILEATQAERHASQQFLSQVNDDLVSISQQNTRAYDHASQLRMAHQSVDQRLERTITDIEHEISLQSAPAADPEAALIRALDELKVIAQENEALKNREQALEEQLAHNQNQLSTLAEQTMDQRRHVGDQERKRLLDPLTRVYNRAALNDRLEHEYRLWKKYHREFCLAVIDIDHFKQVNQQFGYEVGDKALKVIARSIYQCLRDTDFIARFGGEEFVILLPDANDDTRTDILANISQTIRKLPLKFKNERVSITASIGATLFKDQDTPKPVLARADQALYQAKNSGRNQIIWC
ncbi:GGDEF domain-containing protein [Salinivibrio sp. ES.052]|uniref:GGDEF domain-containing protein n=1 Tax=Salinivibrio sp. ES.052 TaxID=1882823 RepID=UPI0009277778|nr:GGDEF domain-containing protein [Salinivibrio sp. ES.052]SIO01296.1 diguanylate cyclase (GGDEF) domain-containing protein [Salinivibrio sp. ES.052]